MDSFLSFSSLPSFLCVSPRLEGGGGRGGFRCVHGFFWVFCFLVCVSLQRFDTGRVVMSHSESEKLESVIVALPAAFSENEFGNSDPEPLLDPVQVLQDRADPLLQSIDAHKDSLSKMMETLEMVRFSCLVLRSVTSFSYFSAPVLTSCSFFFFLMGSVRGPVCGLLMCISLLEMCRNQFLHHLLTHRRIRILRRKRISSMIGRKIRLYILTTAFQIDSNRWKTRLSLMHHFLLLFFIQPLTL